MAHGRFIPGYTPDWTTQIVADALGNHAGNRAATQPSPAITSDKPNRDIPTDAKAPLDPAFVLSQQIDDHAIAANEARAATAEAEKQDRTQIDATDKRIDAVLEHVNDLVGLLDRLTIATNKIVARLNALEAARIQPTTVAVDGQNGPGEVREVQNDIGGESDALHRSSTYPAIPDEWKKYANPPPVETAEKWRLYAAGRPKQGRRIDVLRQTGLLRYVLFVSHDALARTDDPIIAWRYAK